MVVSIAPLLSLFGIIQFTPHDVASVEGKPVIIG